MKRTMLLFGVLAVLLLGGFVALAVTDAPVKTSSISQTIPNERFFDAH